MKPVVSAGRVWILPALLKVSKNHYRQIFTYLRKMGYTEVEKSQRAVIQVSCDLVLTCLDFEHIPGLISFRMDWLDFLAVP